MHQKEDGRMAGSLVLERAKVRWFLSDAYADLPPAVQKPSEGHRSFAIGGREVELSSGRHALHTTAYQEILAGRGFGIEAARPSLELVHHMRTAPVVQAIEDPQVSGFLR